MAWIRPGQLGYIGPDLGVDLHATPVAVLSIGLDAPFTLETAGHGATTVRSAYAPARTTHRVVAPEGRILLLLIDPAGTPAGRLAAAVRADPSRAFRAHETASRLGLSTSHFLRLFAQHTGTTFRRYQQWARLLHAVRGMVAGHDLTRCATDAGFASPSHFSDTFHRTFGLSPSALLNSRVQIDLGVIEP